MTKVPMEKPPPRMGTLDKLWGSIPEEEDDTMLINTEERGEEDRSKNKTKKTKMTNPAATTTPYQMNQSIVPLFQTTVRFYINAPSASEAFNQHIDILKTIKQTMKHCEVYSKETEEVQFEELSIDSFDYHELHGKRKAFVIVHKLVLDWKYIHIYILTLFYYMLSLLKAVMS